MLFDLRGRGRRRTIQGIYLGLAVLMGGGLVFFGVGGSGFGLLNADQSNGGGGGGGSSLTKQVKAADKAAAARPSDPAAWLNVVRLRYQLAGQGKNYDPNTSAFTASGRQELARAAQDWQRYLALNPPRPDSTVAQQMVNAFSPDGGGLNQPAQAAAAQEIVASATPSPRNYGLLAQFAYLAGQTRKGDLAAAKAVSLTPSAKQKEVRQALAQAKSQATSGAGAGTTQAPSSGGQPAPAK